MGFLDKLKDAANKVGDTVEKGVKNASDSYQKAQEKSRINKEISEAEKNITNAYTEIGKKFFENHPESEEYAEFYTIIGDARAKIDELNVQLAAFEDKITCTNCGASVAKEAKFCDKCGAKIEIPVVEAQEVSESAETTDAFTESDAPKADVCPSCGAELESGSSFCTKCGTKIGDSVDLSKD